MSQNPMVDLVDVTDKVEETSFMELPDLPWMGIIKFCDLRTRLKLRRVHSRLYRLEREVKYYLERVALMIPKGEGNASLAVHSWGEQPYEDKGHSPLVIPLKNKEDAVADGLSLLALNAHVMWIRVGLFRLLQSEYRVIEAIFKFNAYLLDVFASGNPLPYELKFLSVDAFAQKYRRVEKQGSSNFFTDLDLCNLRKILSKGNCKLESLCVGATVLEECFGITVEEGDRQFDEERGDEYNRSYTRIYHSTNDSVERPRLVQEGRMYSSNEDEMQRRRMSSSDEDECPPAKKSKVSTTISMMTEYWPADRTEQKSEIVRFKGYLWHIRLYLTEDGGRKFSLICEKSSESALWECTATIRTKNRSGWKERVTHRFTSWGSREYLIYGGNFKIGRPLVVEITTEDHGKSWTRRPYLDPDEPLDGIFVVAGEGKRKKIRVNKKFMSAQCFFFDRLFNGDWMEKDMRKIPIGDVEYKDFKNIIRMINGSHAASLTDENVDVVLHLADRFDLKIVQDLAISFLLSSACSLPVVKRFIFAELYNLPYLTKNLLTIDYTDEQLQRLYDSRRLDRLSVDTVRAILKMCEGRVAHNSH